MGAGAPARLAALAALALAAAPRVATGQEPGAVAGTIEVERPPGQAAEPVIVYVVGFTEPPPRTTARILQVNKRFVPSLLAITAGQKVGFPNGDPFLHNVFSSSPLRRFDLGSFPEGETRERRFPDPGVVDVFCNIHPEMSATILVLPNRRFALTSRDGRFHIGGVPPGRWSLFAYSRAAIRPVGARVTVTAASTAHVRLSLTEQPLPDQHRNKFGEPYREPSRLYR